MPLLWELLKSKEEQDYLRDLILKKRKNWRPPSSDGPIHGNAELEGLEEIAVIMETPPRGKQAVLGSGK